MLNNKNKKIDFILAPKKNKKPVAKKVGKICPSKTGRYKSKSWGNHEQRTVLLF